MFIDWLWQGGGQVLFGRTNKGGGFTEAVKTLAENAGLMVVKIEE